MKKLALSAILVIGFAGAATAQTSAGLLGGAGAAGMSMGALIVIGTFVAITASGTSGTN